MNLFSGKTYFCALASRARGDGDAALAIKWLRAMNDAAPEMILKLRQAEDEEEEEVSQKQC